MHGEFFRDEQGKLRIFRIVGAAIGGVLLAILLAVGLGWLVQYLWNHTVSVLFNWPTITYWQAVGLFLLGKLLFSGAGHGGHHGGHGPKYKHHYGKGNCRRGWESYGHWDYAHFHEFWEAEGKSAFKAYMEKMKKENLED